MFLESVSQFRGVNPPGYFKPIAKTQMYTALRNQIIARHLRLAIGRDLRFHRAKSQIGTKSARPFISVPRQATNTWEALMA